MENLIINESELKVKYIPMSNNDRYRVRFGDICDQCNSKLNDDSVYIPVLNMMMCSKCSSRYLSTHKMYDEDLSYQERNINRLINKMI